MNEIIRLFLVLCFLLLFLVLLAALVLALVDSSTVDKDRIPRALEAACPPRPEGRPRLYVVCTLQQTNTDYSVCIYSIFVKPDVRHDGEL